jgi:hypothetical protein
MYIVFRIILELDKFPRIGSILVSNTPDSFLKAAFYINNIFLGF